MKLSALFILLILLFICPLNPATISAEEVLIEGDRIRIVGEQSPEPVRGERHPAEILQEAELRQLEMKREAEYARKRRARLAADRQRKEIERREAQKSSFKKRKHQQIWKV